MTWTREQLSAAPPRKGIIARYIEKHSIDKMALWGTGQDIGEPVHAGVNVSQELALRLSVVWRCVQLLSGTLAGLPADIVRKVDEVRLPVDRPPPWVEQPNPETNYFEFSERVFESLAMDGNAFVLIAARNVLGFPTELWTLHPRQVEIRRDRNSGDVYFLWNGSTRLSKYGPTNPMGDVLHIRLATGGGMRGISPLEAARQAVGLGLVAEKFGARFFGRGQTMSGVIQLPESSAVKTQENISLMRDTWEAAHSGSDQSHRPGILTGGATWTNISVTPEEAQFLETRRFQVEEIASRIYGIPPHMVGLTDKQTSWGTGIEQQATGFVRFTLLPWIIRYETAMSSLLPRGQFVRLNQRGLMRADSATETDVLTKQLLNGVISWDEFRAHLDLAPRPGGNRFMVPAAQEVLESNGLPAPPAPVPSPLQESPSPNGNGRVPDEESVR